MSNYYLLINSLIWNIYIFYTFILEKNNTWLILTTNCFKSIALKNNNAKQTLYN